MYKYSNLKLHGSNKVFNISAVAKVLTEYDYGKRRIAEIDSVLLHYNQRSKEVIELLDDLQIEEIEKQIIDQYNCEEAEFIIAQREYFGA